MTRHEIPKLEFRDYQTIRRVGPFGNLLFSMNEGPDAWERPLLATIDHGHGGSLHNSISIEEARRMHAWLGKALAWADAVTEAA